MIRALAEKQCMPLIDDLNLVTALENRKREQKISCSFGLGRGLGRIAVKRRQCRFARRGRRSTAHQKVEQQKNASACPCSSSSPIPAGFGGRPSASVFVVPSAIVTWTFFGMCTPSASSVARGFASNCERKLLSFHDFTMTLAYCFSSSV